MSTKQRRIGKVSKGGWKLQSILHGGVAAPHYFRGKLINPSFTKSENGAISPRSIFPAMPKASRKGLYVTPAGVASQVSGLQIKDSLGHQKSS